MYNSFFIFQELRVFLFYFFCVILFLQFEEILWNYIVVYKYYLQTEGHESKDKADIEKFQRKQKALEALENLQKFFEYSAVVDSTIYHKINEIEKHAQIIKSERDLYFHKKLTLSIFGFSEKGLLFCISV